jgi:hypothetical protein
LINVISPRTVTSVFAFIYYKIQCWKEYTNSEIERRYCDDGRFSYYWREKDRA